MSGVNRNAPIVAELLEIGGATLQFVITGELKNKVDRVWDALLVRRNLQPA